MGHDHHCPWTSKCVGANNMREFYGFTATTLVFIIYLFASMAMSATSLEHGPQRSL